MTNEITVESKEDRIIITATDAPWVGVKYTLGAVSFSEDEDDPHMSFEYDIVSGTVDDKAAFEKYVGDSIIRMIEDQLREQTLIFKGGV